MARKPEPPPRPSRITIPECAHPLAKLVFSEMKRQICSYEELEWRAGVLRCTFKAWRSSSRPGLETIEAALGALGWALIPVPQHKHLPANIAAGLDALNAEWAGEEPLLHHLLASACLAPILVKREGAVIDVAPVRVKVSRRREPHPGQTVLFA